MAFDSRNKVRPGGPIELTTVEYLSTPETALPRELAYGVLRAADAPTVGRQRLLGDLFCAMVPFVRDRDLGEVLLAPVDVVLDAVRALVVQPDIVFVSNERAAVVTDRIEGAPDLMVEVLAPRPRVGSVEERVEWAARYGVRECWLVSLPHRQVVRLELGDGAVARRHLESAGGTVEGGVLAGLPLPAWPGW